MNTISTKINAILLSTIVAIAPVCASENQSVVIVSEQQDAAKEQDSVVWYKKCSTKHVIAGLAATAIGLYALAVRKNKVAGPVALFTALFCAKKNIAEATNGAKDAESKEVGNKKADINVDGEQPQVKGTEKPQDLHTIDNEKKPEVYVEKNSEDHKLPIVNPDDQKTIEQDIIVQQEITPVDPVQTQQKNDQSLAVPQNVEKNTQPISRVPFHIKAQDSAMDAVRGLKNWVTKGLVSDSFSDN